MNKLINKALLLEQLKRFWPIAAISMLGYLLFILQRLYFPSAPVHHTRMSQEMLELLAMMHPVTVVATVAIPFLTVLALFSYPYRTASAMAFHSFPINRSQLFFTHVLTGLILILGPFLILCLVLLVPIRFVPFHFSRGAFTYFGRDRINNGDIINTLPRVMGFFLRSTLGFVTYFAIFILAASIAGNRVIAIVLSAVIVFAPMAIVGLGEIIASFYILGFGTYNFNLVETVAIYTNPVAWYAVFGGFGSWNRFALTRPLYPLFISYSAIALTAFGLAFLAYRLRPQERAGDAVAFLPIKRMVIFLFALAGMVTMGIFWLRASGSRFGLYSGFAVGFIIAYLIAQMLTEKTFRIGHKVEHLLSYGSVAVGMYVLLLIVANVGFRGYVRNVPQLREITGVIVEEFWMASRHEREEHFFVEDPATIAWVHDIHQGIISESRYLRRARWSNPSLRPWSMHHISIIYRLESGEMLRRSYMLTTDFFHRWNVHELTQSPPVILSFSPALARPEVIEFI